MLPKYVHLSQHALFQEINGEGVILDLGSSRYFGLDGVGVRMWQLLQENPELEVACDQLLQEYDVEKERLEIDLEHLIRELEDASLVSLE